VVDVAPASLMVELAGTEQKIEAFIDLMKPYGIQQVARTGVIAMARGTHAPQKDAAPAATASHDKPGGRRKRSLDAPPAAALPPS
jgi:acetolactate synthase-1/3 small subunit